MSEMERSGKDKENSHSNDVTPESEDETNEEDSLEFIRRCAGFFYFCQEERVKIKIEFPELNSREISQELEKRWYKADTEIKLKYDKVAEHARSRYERLL